MTNDKQQSSVEWLIEKCACADLRPELWEIIKQQAKEMEKEQKQISYADGYSEGYKRALGLIKWNIENQLNKLNTDHIGDTNKIIGGKS
jgi:hypothetical protein